MNKFFKKNKKIILFSSLGVLGGVGLILAIEEGSHYMNYSHIQKTINYANEAYEELQQHYNDTNTSNTSSKFYLSESLKTFYSEGYSSYKSTYQTRLSSFKSTGEQTLKNTNYLSTFTKFMNTSINQLNATTNVAPRAAGFGIGLGFLVLSVGIAALCFFTRNVDKKRARADEQNKKASKKLNN